MASSILCGIVASKAEDRTFLSNSRLIQGTEANLSASLRIGDLDGDLDLDIVVANGRHWPQQNYIFLNQGGARFKLMRPLGEDRATSYATELADLDGDGDINIAVGNDTAPNDRTGMTQAWDGSSPKYPFRFFRCRIRIPGFGKRVSLENSSGAWTPKSGAILRRF